MTWENIISYRRYGLVESSTQGHRSEFIRDYDRIIFLSAFRRLQDKTQVFPLPGNVFVHNRLTHSLEVASVGRSLGTVIGRDVISPLLKSTSLDCQHFYENDLSGVIASACLAHDVGNPAFGHSGEKAIAYFFDKHKEETIGIRCLKEYFSPGEWQDLISFEGNANALRHLTKAFIGKLEGGQRLTYLTLASILKYPCESLAVNKIDSHRKKYGFFQSEKHVFESISDEFGFKRNKDPYTWTRRHPFVFLVEAADDICYRIIDMEDAHRIKILGQEEVTHHFLELYGELSGSQNSLQRTKDVLHKIGDANESIAYLRTKCIGGLVQASSDIFSKNKEAILEGQWSGQLIGEVEKYCPSLKRIESISINKIYNHHSVIEVELAGYNVMSEILNVFVPAILKENRSNMEKKSLLLIPNQFNLSAESGQYYQKVMGVLDFVSGMTDGYATELYRKMKGIDIASHRL
ncbi:MAG: dNTP triphosphohydrolase [Saprospiraceae bacterium]